MARPGFLSAAVLLAGATGSGCARGPEARLDLVSRFPEAELRLDALDLDFLAARGEFNRRGWSGLETGGGGAPLVWSVGESSRLRLPFYSVGDKELRLRARCHDSLGPSLSLQVSLNERPLGSVKLAPAEQELRLVLPATAQLAGENLLSFSSSRQREPEPSDPDQRLLVAAFSALEARPLGSRVPLEPPRARDGRITLPAGSAALYHLRIPEAARLRFVATAHGQAGRLLISLRDDEEVVTLANEPLSVDRTLDRGSSLASWAGRLAQLEVANPAQGDALLDRLEIVSPLPARGRSALGPALGFVPHLVIYLVDTLRADYLGVYGHPAPTSPRFDAFAREALLFEDAWAQASWTRPALGSIFTGLYPAFHGADREDRALPAELTTLAEKLKAAGYRTGGFVANHLVGGRFGFDQGFDSWNDADDSLYGASAATLGERALAWLDRGSGPFFLYVHTLEPHSPYSPEAEHVAPFAIEGYAGSRDTRALLRLGQLGRLPAEGLRFLQAQYQGEIRQNDAAFGALLDGLSARRLLEGSVVLFTSDHGEELLEHGGTEHAKTLYQELLRVPLAVRLPGARRAGAREQAVAQQIDLFPTLLSFAGVEVPPGLAGRDLAADWLEQRSAGQVQPLLFAEARFTVISKSSLRAGPWKLILNSDGEALWRAGSALELYHLSRDAQERNNLIASHPIAARFLQRELEDFRERATAARRGRSLTLTPLEQEQLRALGYIQ